MTWGVPLTPGRCMIALSSSFSHKKVNCHDRRGDAPLRKAAALLAGKHGHERDQGGRGDDAEDLQVHVRPVLGHQADLAPVLELLDGCATEDGDDRQRHHACVVDEPKKACKSRCAGWASSEQGDPSDRPIKVAMKKTPRGTPTCGDARLMNQLGKKGVTRRKSM